MHYSFPSQNLVWSVHDMRSNEGVIYRAMAMAATARRPAATEPTFLVAAPLKLVVDGLVLEPVPDGLTGAIGDPVAAEPEPPAAAPPGVPAAAPVPVATGAVPVANPVEPAATCELEEGLKDVLIYTVSLGSLRLDFSLGARALGIVICRGLDDWVRSTGC